MKQSITFRRIAAGDREEFLAMSREFYTSEAVLHPIPDDHHARAFDELMRSDAYLVCYVMELAGQAVGYALLTKTYSREAGGLNVWVDELYLRPGYRGLGAGSAFFAFLEQAHPAARYRLETEPETSAPKASTAAWATATCRICRWSRGSERRGGERALCNTSQQWRSRLLAPRLGRGSLCGNGWWVRVILGGWCRYDEVICSEMTRWGTGAWDGGLMVGVGGMCYVSALACFALIRRWRATFPTRGKATAAVP